jgi:transcriptional regulator with GAF, ATPase, and Fis domain
MTLGGEDSDDFDSGRDFEIGLAKEFAELARLLLAEQDLDTTLRKVCVLAVEHIGGCDHAGISLVEGRHKIGTHGATDDVAVQVDQIQYETGQGPCLDAIRDHETLEVSDLSSEDRWPQFAKTAAGRTGVRSIMAFRLFADSDTFGALNLYSKRVNAFDDDHTAAELGSVFASHAAVALVGARTVDNLGSALETRETIAVAIGMLMARQNVGRLEAFDMLKRASQRMNIKLRILAGQVAGGSVNVVDIEEVMANGERTGT